MEIDRGKREHGKESHTTVTQSCNMNKKKKKKRKKGCWYTREGKAEKKKAPLTTVRYMTVQQEDTVFFSGFALDAIAEWLAPVDGFAGFFSAA